MSYKYNGKEYELLKYPTISCRGCSFYVLEKCQHKPKDDDSGLNCGDTNSIWKEVKVEKRNVIKMKIESDTEDAINTIKELRKKVDTLISKKDDSIVEELRTMLLQRSETGIKKYGVTLDRTDLKPSEWCQHALEETLDFAGYILRLKKDLEKIEKLAKGELGEN